MGFWFLGTFRKSTRVAIKIIKDSSSMIDEEVIFSEFFNNLTISTTFLSIHIIFSRTIDLWATASIVDEWTGYF